METLIGYASILILSSAVVDWFLQDRVIVQLRNHLAEGNSALNRQRDDTTNSSINHLFCQIFDALYGPRFWSMRRFYRSCFLSVLFVTFSILAIGYENTFLGSSGPTQDIIAVAVALTFINMLIDFLSLQETRWVLQRTLRGHTVTLVTWAGIDLVLTTLIYLVGFGSVFFFAISFSDGFSTAVSLVIDWAFFAVLFSPDMALPFFISTYGTSVVWFLFVVFAFAIRGINHNSPRLRTALHAISQSVAPARTVAGIVVVPLAVVLCILEVIRWFV